jgi:4-hydroxythreonine-4-phosphate dehydrogenase
MTFNKKKPRILITGGEPAGIGPDLIIQLSQLNHGHDLTIITDPNLLLERAKLLSLPLNITTDSTTESLKILPVKLNASVKPGSLDTSNANYVLEILNTACAECLSNNYDAVVTTPIQKSVINEAGILFSGHTEYMAEKCGDAFPVMLLACPELRVALVTTHLPLSEVPDAISTESVEKVIRTVIEEMDSRFGIKNPRITVSGLNPHAGEDGHLGTEEQISIIPAIKKFTSAGHHILGPLPADTMFRQEIRQTTDVFICMYHDQGLPVLKTLGFGEAVNITLGLPIIRTSVDHGTALELAGTGKAQCDSLLAAIEMAEEMACNRLNKAHRSILNKTISVNEA